MESRFIAIKDTLSKINKLPVSLRKDEAAVAYIEIYKLITVDNISVHLIKKGIDLLVEVINMLYSPKEEETKAEAMAALGVDLAEALSVRKDKSIEDVWEGVMWQITAFISQWNPTLDGYIRLSTNLIDWVLCIIRNQDKKIKNHHLRLEMVRILELLPPQCLQDPMTVISLAGGLIEACCHIKLHMLVPNQMGASLTPPILALLKRIELSGILQCHVKKGIEQIRYLRINSESKFCANLLKISKDMSGFALSRFYSRHITHSMAVLMLERSVEFLEVAAGKSSPLLLLSLQPGLRQMTLNAILGVLQDTLELFLTYNCSKRNHLKQILRRLNYMIWNSGLEADLKEDHSETVKMINRGLSKVNIELSSLSISSSREFSAENIPEEFIDPVTQKIMSNPYTIHKSRINLDAVTLIQLLLDDDPKDPFTRSPLQDGSFSINKELDIKIRNYGQQKAKCILN